MSTTNFQPAQKLSHLPIWDAKKSPETDAPETDSYGAGDHSRVSMIASTCSLAAVSAKPKTMLCTVSFSIIMYST